MSERYKTNEGLSTADFVAVSGESRKATATDEPPSYGGAKMQKEELPAALFAADEAERLRSKWNDIQVGFVDEPRRSVEQADGLVAEAMKRLAEIFSDERKRLEEQWDRGDNISTEDLRVAMQRYRSFFNRLLSV